MDNIIETKELQIERKHFYVELREMSAAGSCVSPRKLTVAATASLCLARALMNLRRRLLKFLRTAKPRQLNR